MLQEAIEYLVGLGRDNMPDVVKPDAEPSHIYYLRDGNGNLQRRIAEPAPIDHEPSDLQTLADLAIRVQDDGENPEIWVHSGRVELIHERETQRDTSRIYLHQSKQINDLQNLEQKQPWYSQRDFIKLLRVNFRGCLSAHPTLIEIVRKVKFNISESGESEVRIGQSSLGKSINAQIHGTGDLPDEVTLSVPIFANAELKYWGQVVCVLDADPNSKQFQLIPAPGSIENAVQSAMGAIHGELTAMLQGKEIPIYLGRS